MIDSLENSKVIFWNKLKQKKYRDESNLFLIEGPHQVEEALKTNLIKEIITTENKVYDVSIPHFVVSDKVMSKISLLTNHSLVMAVCYKKTSQQLGNRLILLDNIQDPGNMGTIIRSAVAFNYDIIVGLNSVDIYNDKVLRASEGMIFKINIIEANLNTKIKELKNDNYLIIGTDVKKGINIKTITNPKIALIVGNEGNGINKDILSICDETVNIKINPNCESLNVGVASSILMYELSDVNE